MTAKYSGDSGRHASIGRLDMNKQNSLTGQRSGFSETAHIFGLKLRASLLVVLSVSPERVFVPRSRHSSTYSAPWGEVLMMKSPTQNLWCSSHPLVPMWLTSHQIVRCRVSGSLSPSPPFSHRFSISPGCNHSAAWGLFPFPLLTRNFLAAFSACRDEENWGSRTIQYGLWSSCVRCLSRLLWNDDRVSGSYRVPSFFRMPAKKWPSRRSSCVSDSSPIDRVSPTLVHQLCHFCTSVCVLRFVLCSVAVE